MRKSSKKTIVCICVIVGVAVYLRFGVIPPTRLSGVELEIRKRGREIESIARDVKEYEKRHDGNRPARFSDLIEIAPRYSDSEWLNWYELPTNRTANILVYEKYGRWGDKGQLVYVQGRYGAFMADEKTFCGLLNGAITWKDLRPIKKKGGGKHEGD